MEKIDITIKSRGGSFLYSDLENEEKQKSKDDIKDSTIEENKPKLSFVLGRKEAF